MDPRLLEQLDKLNEDEALKLLMQQPQMQLLQAIEAMPYEVIYKGSEAILQFYKEYFKDNPIMLAEIEKLQS